MNWKLLSWILLPLLVTALLGVYFDDPELWPKMSLIMALECFFFGGTAAYRCFKTKSWDAFIWTLMVVTIGFVSLIAYLNR